MDPTTSNSICSSTSKGSSGGAGAEGSIHDAELYSQLGLPVAGRALGRGAPAAAAGARARTRGRVGWLRGLSTQARALRSLHGASSSLPGAIRSLCGGFLVADIELGNHRHALTAFTGDFSGAVVAGVDVADDAHARVIREQARQFLGGQFGAVGHRDLSGVDGAADADATTVVDGHPGRSRGGVD